MDKKTYEERKAKGMCIYCKNKAEKGYTTCPKCRERIKTTYHTRLRNGYCVRCGEKMTDQKHASCFACRMKRAERRYAKKQLSYKPAT